MNMQEQRQQANALRKSKQFAEALLLYEMLWGAETQDIWDGWGYAYCLRKAGRTQEALDVCRAAYQIDSEMPMVRQLYARCIYDLEIAPDEIHDLNRFLKAGTGILRLVEQSNPYAPYTSTIFKVCRQLQQRNRVEDVITWLDRLDLSLLSSESFIFEPEPGQQRRVPSDLQRYYAYRAKAMHQLSRHAECRGCVEEALRTVENFVNDGDLWLRRFHALSLVGEGDLETAYAGLEELLHRKSTWFLYADLADLAYRSDRREVAWHYLLKALLDGSPPELRINVFDHAAIWLEEEGRSTEAKQHLALVLSIRKEHGWPIRSPLQSRAQALNLKMDDQAASRDLLKNLRAIWKKQLDQLEPRVQGDIERLLGDGQAGFIRASDGNSYYFRAKSLRGSQAEPGLAVTFRTAPGFDRKKGKATVDAVDIRAAK